MEKKEDAFKLYIGLANDAGDANTNEIMYRTLQTANISTQEEEKEYKGKKVRVWNVSPDFVKMMYRSQHDFNLSFNVYAERDFILQRFRLFEPGIKKKAKHGRHKTHI